MTARFGDEDGLSASAAFRVDELPLTGVPLAQAEDFSDQGGGQVQVRTDKFGAVGSTSRRRGPTGWCCAAAPPAAQPGT